jgi:hypothetical protein
MPVQWLERLVSNSTSLADRQIHSTRCGCVEKISELFGKELPYPERTWMRKFALGSRKR